MWNGNLTKSELATFKQQVAFGQFLNPDKSSNFQVGIKPTFTNVATVVDAIDDAGIVLKIVGNGNLNGEKVFAHRRSFMFNNGVPTDVRLVSSVDTSVVLPQGLLSLAGIYHQWLDNVEVIQLVLASG